MRKVFFASILMLLLSCNKEIEIYEEIDSEFLAPLELSTSFNGREAFGKKMKILNTLIEDASFARGNTLFHTAWVSAPASTTGLDGLGPTFNANRCDICHPKDGRGFPITPDSNSSRGFLMRLSRPGTNPNGSPLHLEGFGDQFQTQSLLNIPNEGSISVSYEMISGTYDDGTNYTLQKPIYRISENPMFGSLEGALTSPRVGNQLIGLGLIDATTEEEILKNEDINDIDRDGISGKANYILDVASENLKIGKFGWKANQPSLRQQIAAAFHGDMGLTSDLFSEDNCPSPQKDCFDAPNGGDPNQIEGYKNEITNFQLESITFYQSHLAVPIRRNFESESVKNGKRIFTDINCIACHRTNITTGNNALSNGLKNVTYHPYSDFLLHDMGEALADKRPYFKANGKEWRTQPLWGIGRIPSVNKHSFFLHDGRARNIEEAILWHGGESEKSKNQFKKLSQKERDDLIRFIESL